MRIIVLLAWVFSAVSLFGQIENPVQWSTEIKKISNQEYDLLFTANVQDGWNIYSQYLESDDGPIRTSFNYDKGAHYKLVGKNEEIGVRKEGYDKLFGMNVIKLYKKVVFRQRITLTDPSKPISGYLEFMTCNEEKCLPPTEVPFKFLAASATPATEKTPAVPKTPKNEKDGALLIPTPTLEPGQELEKGILADAATNSSLILNPIHWKTNIRKVNESEYELEWVAKIDKGWVIYSQFTGEGPIPTSFTFKKGKHFQTLGKIAEKGHKKSGTDPLFDGNNIIKFLDGEVVFTQKVKIFDPSKPISGTLEYQTCDDSQCLPASIESFQFNPADLIASIGAEVENNGIPAPPIAEASGLASLYAGLEKPDLSSPLGQCGEVSEVNQKTSYWNIFLLGFLGGLLALLTPCVFPMIPLTVSFFTKSSGSRAKGIYQASLYGFFIFAVYLLLSAPFHLLSNINPDILNDISTNVWLNVAFFVVFLVFAFSFFGYYELTLPSSWSNRASSAEGIGGVIGIFFMALTLALVSFSCTGPILGSLLAGALTSDGGAWQLTAGMGGFGLALALPFALFAAFPSVMKTLPKSGSWLNTVKVTLGFLEIALALKFLSNADLVKHWELLKIEPFLGLWILVFLGLALYLFGLIRFPHDSKGASIPWAQRALGLVSLAFTVYLVSGFRYDEKVGTFHSLTLLSGLAPPAGYSWIHPNDCPQNLNCFKDLDAGMAYARENNKPILIDFTGHACVNCRKMEENVWPTAPVYPTLSKDYVLISLYVDDKRELPEDQQIVVNTTNGYTRKLRTIGNKWSHFQTEYFATNTQPYYVLLTPNGQVLAQPRGYTPDEATYGAFLNCGKAAFKQLTLGN
jgi:thiol:disulfide interchange protein DsbD